MVTETAAFTLHVAEPVQHIRKNRIPSGKQHCKQSCHNRVMLIDTIEPIDYNSDSTRKNETGKWTLISLVMLPLGVMNVSLNDGMNI